MADPVKSGTSPADDGPDILAVQAVDGKVQLMSGGRMLGRLSVERAFGLSRLVAAHAVVAKRQLRDARRAARCGL